MLPPMTMVRPRAAGMGVQSPTTVGGPVVNGTKKATRAAPVAGLVRARFLKNGVPEQKNIIALINIQLSKQKFYPKAWDK